MTRKWVITLLFIVYCLFIIWYTILSRNPDVSRADFRLFWSYRELLSGDPHGKTDVIQNLNNILFFIPFGLFFPGKHWIAVLVSAALFSTAIETIQYFGGFGLAELDDVISNTLGAMIGLWIVVLTKRIMHGRKSA